MQDKRQMKEPKMTVYLDVVLIENLCMNYIILFATAYILKIKVNHIRIILSALLGGIYAILAYMEILEIYSNIFLKVILSIAMIYLAFKPKRIKELGKELVFFYLISFVFGGCAFALLYFIKPQNILIKNGSYVGTYPIKVAILGGIVGFTITAIAFKVVKSKLSKKDIYCEITIWFEEKHVTITAMLDTGNMLKDPITQMPVIVVEKNALKDILPNSILDNLKNIIGGDVAKEVYEDENLKYITKFRVIPFSSIGKENGMLLGFKADKVIVNKDENIKTIQKAIVGIYDYSLSKKNEYSALIGFDIIEGSELNEYTTNISR